MKITLMVVHLLFPATFPRWFLVEPPKDAYTLGDGPKIEFTALNRGFDFSLKKLHVKSH